MGVPDVQDDNPSFLIKPRRLDPRHLHGTDGRAGFRDLSLIACSLRRGRILEDVHGFAVNDLFLRGN